MLMCQVEAGVQCPVTMTYGAVPACAAAERHRYGVAAPHLFPKTTIRGIRPAAEKTGALIGMGMTGETGRQRSARQCYARRAFIPSGRRRGVSADRT